MSGQADHEDLSTIVKRTLALWRLVFVVSFQLGLPCGLGVMLGENFADFTDALSQLIRFGSIVSCVLATPFLVLAYLVARHQTPAQAAPIRAFSGPFFWIIPLTGSWVFANLCVGLRDPDVIFIHAKPAFIYSSAIDIGASGWWLLAAIVIVCARWFFLGESLRWEPLEASL